MAGYNNFSKSNNAIQAEHEGYFPASVLAKKLNVSTKAITAILSPSEWHHTSNYYNKTNYYSYENAREKLAELKAYKAEKPAESKYFANVKYIEWQGTRKYPKAIEHVYNNIEITEKGCFYIFHTPDGDIRKKIGSNGTMVTRI